MTMQKEKVNQPNNKDMLVEEEVFKDGLENLRGRLTSLKDSLSGLNQCSHLSNLLQKIHEVRDGLNNLEQSLLQTHLKGYISPSVKVLEVVALAVFKLTGNVVGEPLRTSKKIT